MIVLFLILNAVVSCFNAWGCGKTWTETKYVGGMPHFMNWMGAIMSAMGFTWCYLVIFGFFGSTIPFDQGKGVSAPYLNAQEYQAFCDLGYSVIIVPILGSGLAITLHAWGVAWRRRTVGSIAVTGYDTFAQIYNMRSAFEYLPQASKGLGKFFNSKSDKKGAVIVLVLAALLAGILTTRWIIQSTAKVTAMNRGLRYRATLD